jgi:hypothetical protein
MKTKLKDFGSMPLTNKSLSNFLDRKSSTEIELHKDPSGSHDYQGNNS